jgi:hypothetical protein
MPEFLTSEVRSAYYRQLAYKSAKARRVNGAARRSEAATEKLAAHIAKVLESAPPLNDEQRQRLTELLGPARPVATVTP